MGNLAGILLQLGYSGQPEQFDKAEKYCKGALEIIGAGKDKRRQSYLLGSLGNIYLHKKTWIKLGITTISLWGLWQS